MCSNLLVENLNTSNCHFIKILEDMIRFKELVSSTNAFIEEKIMDIIEDEEFLDSEYYELKVILSSEKTDAPKEEDVYKARILSLKHDIAEIINFISDITSLIRFSQISEQIIKTIKKPLIDYQKLILKV